MFEQMGATVSFDPAGRTATVTKPGATIVGDGRQARGRDQRRIASARRSADRLSRRRAGSGSRDLREHGRLRAMGAGSPFGRGALRSKRRRRRPKLRRRRFPKRRSHRRLRRRRLPIRSKSADTSVRITSRVRTRRTIRERSSTFRPAPSTTPTRSIRRVGTARSRRMATTRSQQRLGHRRIVSLRQSDGRPVRRPGQSR